MSKAKQKASGNGKSYSFIFLVMIFMIIVLGALAGYALYQIHNVRAEMKSESSQSISEEKVAPILAPIYAPLDDFTVSLKSGDADNNRVLYVGLTLRLKDENAKTLLQQFMPEIRSRLLLLFAQQTAEVLETDGGKVELIRQIKDVVNRPLADKRNIIVSDVLFNAFILR